MNSNEIELALSNEKLDVRMIVDPANDGHKWFQVALDQGNQLCARSNLPLTFAFNCSPHVQAYALYKYNLIVMSAGCFNFICRLADKIVATGAFQAQDLSSKLHWSPTSESAARSIRDLIGSDPFLPSKTQWANDEERVDLFAYLMTTLFRFVVLHEIGHFHHQHGKRFKGQFGSLDVDSAQPRLLSEPEAIHSQAREIVADKFSCEILERILEDEISGLRHLKNIKGFARRHLRNRVKRICFILQMVYIYFSVTDCLPNADPSRTIRMSHPPAPFRLTTLVATALTGFRNESDRRKIKEFLTVANNVMAFTLDRVPERKWLAQLDHPEFVNHYKNLYKTVDLWALTQQKAPQSAADFV